MKIAIVSDIHGNLPALEAVITAIAREGADLVVNLGDIVSGPLWPRETAQRLRALAWPTIAGNHERQVLTQARERMGPADRYAADALGDDDRAWLAGLPRTLALLADVFCCHGTPTSDLVYFMETVTPGFGVDGSPGVRAATADEVRERLGAVSAPLVMCGHTHVPRVLQCGATLVVNPGSVGVQAFEGSLPHPHVVETGAPLARWATATRGPAGWSAALHATAYDWRAAAAQARAAGRPEWAEAIETGRLRHHRTDAAG